MKESVRKRLLSRLSYQTALVGGVALLSSTLLSLANIVTTEEIALRRAEDLSALLEQVIPPALYDNNLLEDVFTIKEQSLINDELQIFRARLGNNVEAVAFQTSVPGYAGPIVVLMGIRRDGEILGTRVISHTETPGLGDKIEIQKSDWIESFSGTSLQNPTPDDWAVKKDGGVFDQFTGATITPRRTINAIRNGLEFFEANKRILLDQQTDENENKPIDIGTRDEN